jgi:ceramide glucosyltransferase
MIAVFLVLLAFYAFAAAARIALAAAYLSRKPGAPGREADVTILQPILSGDPALAACLAANLAASPAAQFLWLIDDDDAEAQRIAAALPSAHMRVVLGPPPADGENPKVAKLARAEHLIATPLFAVLDDDTALPAGGLAAAAGALAGGDLVTGLPVYVSEGGLWTRLVAAFVNGSALITYPAAALLGQQRTINGMFYLGRTADLRALGGFGAILGELTDDYAIAKLYLGAAKRIVQSHVIHPIRTTAPELSRYLSIMRRWMIFAMRYMRENASPFTLGLIGAPTLAPLLLVVASALAGAPALGIAVLALLLKAAAMALLRRRFAARSIDIGEIVLEPIADILTPLHLAGALVRPHAFAWRSRRVRMDGDRIGYR